MEEITRSPTTGQLTTSPAFSPPSANEDNGDGDSNDDKVPDSKTDSDEEEDEEIPEGLRPQVLPPSPNVDQDDESSASGISFDSDYVPFSPDPSVDENIAANDDIPLDCALAWI